MPILKHADVAPLLADPTIVLDLGDLQRQAARLIAAAEQEADRIVAAARAQAEAEGTRIRTEAEAAGRAEGDRIGRAEGQGRGRMEAMDEARASLAALQAGWVAELEDWSARRSADLAASREDVVALAIAIAERVVHRTIDADRSVAVRQASSALELLAQARDVRVAVHPEDRPRLAEAMPELLRALSGDANVELVDDVTVDRGGVVVRSGEGLVDARIDVQLDRIADALVPGRQRMDASTGREPVAAGDAVDAVGGEVDDAVNDAVDDTVDDAVGDEAGNEAADAADDGMGDESFEAAA